MSRIIIAALLLWTIQAQAKLPIYVDRYDASGRLIGSHWYCSNGKRVPCNGYPIRRKKETQA